MPRPSKYTSERAQRVLEAIAAGATRRAAALHAGVDAASLYRWIGRYASFATALAKAEADVEVRAAALVQQAAQNDWRAAAWWLERRLPEDYGRRDRVDLNIRQRAERLAGELGMRTDDLIAEAERIVSGVERHG